MVPCMHLLVETSHIHVHLTYQELDRILIDIKNLGYQADTSFVLQDLEEEEKEKALLYHSEKLAIAFGVLSLSEDKTIFVTKNLRVCGDCHSAIKFFFEICTAKETPAVVIY
jgi:hypothetical protein